MFVPLKMKTWFSKHVNKKKVNYFTDLSFAFYDPLFYKYSSLIINIIGGELCEFLTTGAEQLVTGAGIFSSRSSLQYRFRFNPICTAKINCKNRKKINKSPTGRNARSRCKLYRVRRIYLFYRTVFPHGLRRAFSTSIRRHLNLTPNPEVFDETVVDCGSFAFENRIFRVNGGGRRTHKSQDLLECSFFAPWGLIPDKTVDKLPTYTQQVYTHSIAELNTR